MPHIPQSVLERCPLIPGLALRHRGKVRDSYYLPEWQDEMLVVATNRISSFDFVLNALIDDKGEVLNALSHFWTTQVIQSICKTDLVAAGAEIDQFLPEELRGNTDLQARATVVKVFSSPEVEDIVRIFLTGSGLKSYEKDRIVCGHSLPAGLQNGSKLPYPIYTPTTKATVGHDEHITADSVVKRFSFLHERIALQVAQAIATYAESRGILLFDTKFEMSDVDGTVVLVDEKGTPDSSRYVDTREWQKAFTKGKLAKSLDKQSVRDWLAPRGVDNKLDPTNPEHVARAHALELPSDIRELTTRIYRYIFWRITGRTLESYQKNVLGIAVEPPTRRIEVIVGSRSDLEQVNGAFAQFKGMNFNVMSCHRNPDELRRFLLDRCDGNHTDVIIAGAGMAAALPGIVKSWLSSFGSAIPVIGVAFEGKTAKDNEAAVRSIENLPGQPVELDNDGRAYFGSDGFIQAVYAAREHEFLPKTIEAKPAEIGVTLSTD